MHCTPIARSVVFVFAHSFADQLTLPRRRRISHRTYSWAHLPRCLCTWECLRLPWAVLLCLESLLQCWRSFACELHSSVLHVVTRMPTLSSGDVASVFLMQYLPRRLYCEFRVESLNGNTEFSSGSTVHQEIEASDADSVPMLNTSETL